MHIRHHQLGFTFIELLISLSIIAVIATLAIPLLGDKDAMNVTTTKQLLVSDIELAQVMAISHPEDQIGLVIQDWGWHIASLDDPNTPLDDTITGDPLVLQFGIGSAASISDVQLVTNAINNTIEFDQTGGLVDISQETEVEIVCQEDRIVVLINPTTGNIQ